MDLKNQTAYTEDFESFLNHTNEKTVLLNEISNEIKYHNIQSLLDIGAGNGDLSIPLSKLVSRYLAIEPKDSYAKKLTKAGVKNIHSSFPTEVQGQFDMVLLSHSISYESMDVDEFIKQAWELVVPGGVLLIITYNSLEGDWLKLTQAVGSTAQDSGRFEKLITYPEMIEKLEELGNLKIRKVITNVKTKTLQEIINALSFVSSNGIPAEKQKFLEKRLELELFLDGYKTASGYEFPFYHYFITVTK